jgi:predicted hydrocarbon binding protein
MAVSDFVEKLMFSKKLTFAEGKFEMFGVEGVIFPADVFTKMLEVTHEKTGEEVFEIMFESGRKQGNVAIEEIGKKNNMKKKEFFSKMVESANVMGIWKLEVEKFSEEGSLVCSLTDSPITREIKQSEEFEDVNKPVENFFRGLIHGLGEEVFEEKVKSEFTKSEYMGDPKTVVRTRVDHGDN